MHTHAHMHAHMHAHRGNRCQFISVSDPDPPNDTKRKANSDEDEWISADSRRIRDTSPSPSPLVRSSTTLSRGHARQIPAVSLPPPSLSTLSPVQSPSGGARNVFKRVLELQVPTDNHNTVLRKKTVVITGPALSQSKRTRGEHIVMVDASTSTVEHGGDLDLEESSLLGPVDELNMNSTADDAPRHPGADDSYPQTSPLTNVGLLPGEKDSQPVHVMKSALNASYGSRDLQLEKGGEGRETKAVSSRLNQEVAHVRVPTSVQVGLDTLPRAHVETLVPDRF